MNTVSLSQQLLDLAVVRWSCVFTASHDLKTVALIIPLRSRERQENEQKTLQQLRGRERELENEVDTEREEREREVTALMEEKGSNEQRIAEVMHSGGTDSFVNETMMPETKK